MEQPDVARFYDELAESYHLLYADAWDAATDRQATALDALIRGSAPEAKRVLDGACGIGTQAIGLALRGYSVTGSDLSHGALNRAQREAQRRGTRLALVTADLRAPPWRDRTFDAVLACDNALSHLLDDVSLERALTAVRAVLRRGGIFIATVRLHEQMLGTPLIRRGTRVLDDPPRRVTRIHERSDASPLYTVSFEIAIGNGSSEVVHTYATRLRGWTREDLSLAVARADFSDIAWPQAVILSDQAVLLAR